MISAVVDPSESCFEVTVHAHASLSWRDVLFPDSARVARGASPSIFESGDPVVLVDGALRSRFEPRAEIVSLSVHII